MWQGNRHPFVLGLPKPKAGNARTPLVPQSSRWPCVHHLPARRRIRRTERWSLITDIANTTGLAGQSLLTFLLRTPEAAIVLVLEDALDGSGGTRCVWFRGAPEDHQRDYDCESSGPKTHGISIPHLSRSPSESSGEATGPGLYNCKRTVRSSARMLACFGGIGNRCMTCMQRTRSKRFDAPGKVTIAGKFCKRFYFSCDAERPEKRPSPSLGFIVLENVSMPEVIHRYVSKSGQPFPGPSKEEKRRS